LRTVLRRAGLAIVATGLVVLTPAAAQAKTKSVTMGLPLASQSTFQHAGSDVNDFFPHGVRIHAGDKVRFVPTGFHTVNFPAKGQDPDSLVAPAGKISGINDAAGQPFWFDGQDNLQFNPALGAGLFGKHVTLNAAKGLQSGAPFSNAPQPFTVKFKKAGKYTYFCNIHPGMKGTVTVVKKGKRIPTAAQDRKTVKAALKRDLKVANKLPKANIPAGTISVGNAGPHGVEYYGMLPATLTVPVGTTLNFHLGTVSVDVHTATFGLGNPETEPTSYLGQISASFQGTNLDQRGIYPSEAPGTTATLTSTLHGNGFWNSGVMDNSSASPLPSSNKVTFGAPGTYNYYCMIHPFMHGVINVQ
jgi:plastocyanin